MRRVARVLLALGIASAVTLGLAGVAAAHANLASSDPAANASLDHAPADVTMTFTEPPDPKLSVVHVLDVNGTDVEAGPVQAVPGQEDQLRSPLPTDLPDGVYTVSWRVVSEADGHSTAGAFSFGVNVAPGTVVAPSIPVPTTPAPSAASVASKLCLYVGPRDALRRERRRAPRVRWERACAATDPADRIGGRRRRRRRDAPVGTGRARRIDGRPAVVLDGPGLPLAARRRDVRRRRLDRCGATVGSDVARRGRGRRVVGHAHPRHRGPRLRRRDPRARDRLAVVPLHGGERLDGRPLARVPGGSREPVRASGRRGPPLFVPRRLRGGRRPGHRRAPRHGGGRRPLQAPAPVLHLVPHHARHQGRGGPAADRAGGDQPLPFDPADGCEHRTPPARHGDRAGGCAGGLRADRHADRPVAAPARHSSGAQAPTRHAHRQRLRHDDEGHPGRLARNGRSERVRRRGHRLRLGRSSGRDRRVAPVRARRSTGRGREHARSGAPRRPLDGERQPGLDRRCVDHHGRRADRVVGHRDPADVRDPDPGPERHGRDRRRATRHLHDRVPRRRADPDVQRSGNRRDGRAPSHGVRRRRHRAAARPRHDGRGRPRRRRRRRCSHDGSPPAISSAT